MAANGFEFILAFVHPSIQSSTHVRFLIIRIVLADTIVQSIPGVVHDTTCSTLTFLEGVQGRKVVAEFMREKIPQITILDESHNPRVLALLRGRAGRTDGRIRWESDPGHASCLVHASCE
jgi:hypothetical protein